MRLAFITQAVDADDPILAFAIRWIEAFATNPRVESLSVIALRAGRFSLPSNVTVRAVHAAGRATTLARFYGAIFDALRRGVDAFFIHLGGPYPALLFPFKLLGKPLFQWKAHSYLDWKTKAYARYALDLIFTPTYHDFPLRLAKVRAVGHGVDVERFRPLDVEKTGDLIVVGRIAPIKKVDEILQALHVARHRFGKRYRLDIYGPVYDKDRPYFRQLLRSVKELGLEDAVSFCGPLSHEALPKVLNRYRAFLFYCRGALGKAALEAMACGLPVITTNPSVIGILPDELRDWLAVPRDDPSAQAERLVRVMALGDKRLQEMGRLLRAEVVRHHNVQNLADRILGEIEQWLSAR